MKRILLVIVISALVIAVGAWAAIGLGGLGWITGTTPQDGSSPPASSGDDDSRNVAALGQLEPADGILTVATIVGDRLISLEVNEGGQVTKGATLGVLDSRELRELEVESTESQLKEAKARRAAEEALADARIATAELAIEQAQAFGIQIEAQKKQVELARANFELERKNQDRLAQLSDQLVSEAEREGQALLVQKAEAELAAAEAMLKKVQQESAFALQKAQAELTAAKAGKTAAQTAVPVESLEKGLELAQEQFERSLITAPSDGTILKIYTQPGELITQKPILQMADLSRMVCVAEVYEADVKRLRVGQQAIIRSNALPAPGNNEGLKGTIQRIGRMIAAPELDSLDPFATADRHVVEVRIELDEANSRIASQMVNLQVDVTFLSSP